MAASSNAAAVYNDRELLGNMTNPTFADVAEQCRLPLQQLSHEEAEAFPDLAGNVDRQQTFVQFRNKILQVWLQRPDEELTLEKCRQVALAGARKSEDNELLTRVYHWLVRAGFINYGVFTLATKRRGAQAAALTSSGETGDPSSVKGERRTALVIGAGIAGLTAARQLAYFGFDVTVLEARERLGGRICTVTRDYSVDLGAMVITGLIGNPLAVLLKQLKPKMVKINHRCPLYDSDGDLIPAEIDEPIEREFNRILRAAAFLANDEQLEQELLGERSRVSEPEADDADADKDASGRGSRVSLGEVVDGVIALQRRTCLRRSVALLQALVELKLRAKPAFEKLRELCERVKRTYAEVERERQRGTPPAKAMRLSAAAAGSADASSASASGSQPPLNFVTVTPEMEAEAEREINRRLLEARLRREIQEYEETEREYSQVEQRIADVQAQLAQLKPMQDIYANSYALRTLYWHVANLEFANATALDKLSLRFWDQDDHYRFDGAHVILADGYKVVAQSLSRDLNIKYLQAVKSIEYDDERGVTVTTVNSKQKTSETTVYKADCVLCTLPLGVLKGTVAQARAAAEAEAAGTSEPAASSDTCTSASASANSGEKGTGAAAAAMQNAPRFVPSLPRWKTAAIRRLGYGTLNKVALRFSHFFWDRSLHLFGYVNETLEARGEYYLFWSYITAAPVLIAFVAGRAAELFETAPNETILKRVVSVLQRIFAKKGRDVPWPKQAIISRWRSDVWSLGSYSYVAANCTGDEYDLLALPVSSDSNASSEAIFSLPPDVPNERHPRLFFAGEHTVRNFPATVNGAFLSGMREARRIADIFTGRPYAGPARPPAAESAAADVDAQCGKQEAKADVDAPAPKPKAEAEAAAATSADPASGTASAPASASDTASRS